MLWQYQRKIIFKDMQSRKICGFSGLAFSRMGVKESGLFSGRQTIWNALRFALGINSRRIILDFANPAGLRPRRICFFTGRVVTGNCICGCRPLAKAQQIKCLLRQRSPPGSWRAATEGRSNRWKPKIRLKDLHAEWRESSVFSVGAYPFGV